MQFEKLNKKPYDSQNQLIREDNERLGLTYTYSYDCGGNLTAKKCYSYTTGNLPSTPNQQYEYTYGGATATWKDQLTGYNGETITYDGVGNPLTDRNGMEFTWQSGRKLAGMQKSGTSATYKYNSDGIRTEKVVNGVKTVYYIVDNLEYFQLTMVENNLMPGTMLALAGLVGDM